MAEGVGEVLLGLHGHPLRLHERTAGCWGRGRAGMPWGGVAVGRRRRRNGRVGSRNAWARGEHGAARGFIW
jgi:hypothetical protein